MSQPRNCSYCCFELPDTGADCSAFVNDRWNMISRPRVLERYLIGGSTSCSSRGPSSFPRICIGSSWLLWLQLQGIWRLLVDSSGMCNHIPPPTPFIHNSRNRITLIKMSSSLICQRCRNIDEPGNGFQIVPHFGGTTYNEWLQYNTLSSLITFVNIAFKSLRLSGKAKPLVLISSLH